MFSSALHSHTPELVVLDARGLSVAHVQLYRSQAEEVAVARVTGQRFDPAGRLIAAIDPRLERANRINLHSLSGSALFTESVDAGWRLALFGEGGQVLADWDGRGSERQVEYDALLRPEKIVEQTRVVDVFTYGGMNSGGHNQRNQLIRHDGHAGTLIFDDYGLHGSALSETRHFTLMTEKTDWPSDEPGPTARLEPIGLQTRRAFNAVGDVVEQTDTKGNRQVFGHTVAGQLKEARLTLAGGAQQHALLSETHYNAFDQIEQETAGNGVVSRYSYDRQDGRLATLSSTSAQGCALQMLFYSYDPLGNILRLEDASQMDNYTNNQCIEPISRYTYDTLYQLIEATGREVRNGASHGPALPGLQPLPMIDPCQVSNYKQRYHYDAAGNLLQMRHEGAHDFTRNMHVAPDSNRSLPDDDSEADFNTNFDANGNLLQLVRGQTMSWNVRNQLERLTTVQRKQESNDEERYFYDGQGQRCRKISTSRASGRTLTHEVRYLPGLEIRTSADGEILHVITAQAGRNSVRVLHWDAGKPAGIANDQVRYSVGDHLGSSTLELDHRGSVISHESYYPFGGTAWWAARSAVEAKYKTVRYSGKERDASGVYYYGFRYYAPWLQRWINPDPAGDVGGLNQFIFVVNNPLSNADTSGLVPYQVTGLEDRLAQARRNSIEHYQFVEKNLRHQRGVLGEYSIGSRQARLGLKANEFVNTYAPDEWTFHMNFNHPNTQRMYYANEVAVFQYTEVARHCGFFGQLPHRIIRENISNEQTRHTVGRYESGSPELKDAFLSKTPTGKTTQRILEDFGLSAIRVDKVFNRSQLDMHIHVEPATTSTRRSPLPDQEMPPPLPTSKPPGLEAGLQYTTTDAEDTPPALPLSAPPQQRRHTNISTVDAFHTPQSR